MAWRICVVSDTHQHTVAPWLERLFHERMLPCDTLVHCGDITGDEVLDLFRTHPDAHIVAGNMDGFGFGDSVPLQDCFEVAGLRVFAVHGYGFGSPVGPGVVHAVGTDYDLVCYGHTHRFDWSEYRGVQLLNPGSLHAPRAGQPSFAIVNVEEDGALDVEQVVVAREG